jgi:hypothetical protein
MNKQQIRKFKEYAEKLLGLCEGEAIPPLKLIEDGHDAHFETCERNAYEAGKIQDKPRRDYRKKVLALLEADWVSIVRIFEDQIPQRIPRLNEMRKTILDHTNPDKIYENWLEPRDGKLSPNKYLSRAIKKLSDEILQTAKEAVRGNKLEDTKKPAETEQKAKGGKIMITVKTSKEIWVAIKSEYDISKIDFARKIKFVKDKFKKNVISRDVEHAFILSSQGFPKPAVILAGGVIEELLRLYLKRKRIRPKDETFSSYIKACEDNKLLKRGVYRLSDSIRDFRNLVHLKNETIKKHTVSVATAKGAVSSIFTIANDFQ